MSISTGIGFGAFIQEDGSVVIGKGCDGDEIPNISAITIRVAPDEIVTAVLDVAVIPEKITANPMLSLDSLKQAAAFHGYELTPMQVSHVDIATGQTEYIKSPFATK